jgi:DNA-binding NarL/FixJ family response regulator
MTDKIRVVIADDHRLIRESLRQILSGEANIKVVGEAATGPRAIDVITQLKPDIVLLDIYMPEMDGFSAIQPIREKSPKTKILILTVAMDEDMVFKALKAGAKGYISKDASFSDLIKAIQTIHQGEVWVERKLISRFLEEEAVVDTEEDPVGAIEKDLTPREQEVLRCLATGCKNKEIGEALFISEKTVKTHLKSIFRKLNVSTRLEATLHAIAKGLN